MSTYFPHHSLWIYTGVLPFEILELVRGKWGTCPLTRFELYDKEEPLGNKLSSGVNVGRQQSSLLQSETHHLCSTSTSYTTPNADFPDEHPFWTRAAKTWLWKFSEAEFATLVLAVTDILFLGSQHQALDQKSLSVSQDTYCNTLVTKLVAEEVWLIS